MVLPAPSPYRVSQRRYDGTCNIYEHIYARPGDRLHLMTDNVYPDDAGRCHERRNLLPEVPQTVYSDQQ